MHISISAETGKLLDEVVKRGGYSTSDQAIRAALERLRADATPLEDLDTQTGAAIERAEAQSCRGEGIPVDEAFERVRRKHFGQ